MTIRVCKDDRYECYEEEFTTNQTGEQRITKTVKHLTPGSNYTVTVFFTSNGTEAEGDIKNFITTASDQLAPDNFVIAAGIIAAIIVLGVGVSIAWVACFKPPKYNVIHANGANGANSGAIELIENGTGNKSDKTEGDERKLD